MNEKCGECGYDIEACNEIAMLRAALLKHATPCTMMMVESGSGKSSGLMYECAICGSETHAASLHGDWHKAGCILGPRACDMAAATEVARAFDDRRMFGGSGFLMVDATMPGGLRRLDPASVTIKFPTTEREAKL